MTELALFQQFCALSDATLDEGQQAYAADSIEGYPKHKIAKSAGGNPAVLFELSRGGAGKPPLHLKNLSLLPNVECQVKYKNGASDCRTFTIVSLDSGDPVLQEFFFAVVQSLLPQIGNDPDYEALNSAIDHLRELFRSLATPPTNTAAGLWGELFLVSRSLDPVLLISCWHSSPDEAVDFVSGNQRVEVKTTTSSFRRHRFSAAQLSEPSGTTLIIASIMTRRVATGLSLAQLVSRVRRQCSIRADLVRKIDRIVASSLGSAFVEGLELEFDEQHAESNLKLVLASHVPALLPPFPKGISEVDFSADLTGVDEAPLSSFPLGSLLRCLGGERDSPINLSS